MNLLFCILVGHSHAIVNGGFKQAGTPNEGFTPPSDWAYENYAGLHSNFVPEGPSWSITEPFEGNQFVLLSTGGFGTFPDKDIEFAQLSQRSTFNAGQVLSFAWFFGSTDYLPYEDYATALLVPANPNAGLTEIPLVSISLWDVGNYGSTGDWQNISFAFDSTTAGEYDLVFEVRDYADALSPSYFAIDGITVVPEPITLALLGLGGLALVRKRR